MRCLIPMVSFVLAVPASGAIVRRHDVSDASLVEAGARFGSVCTVAGDGAGTLVADRWVLTAAHVAADLPPFGASVRFGDATAPIVGVVLHPEGQAPPGMPPEVDLALLLLGETPRDVAPSPIYRDEDEAGSVAWLVGAGDFGTPDQVEATDRVRRAGTNVIDDVGPVRIFMRFDAPPGGTPLECVSGPGDSGGPAFIDVGGVMHVAGVSSAASGGRPGSYGVREVYARVGTQQGWIDATIESGAAPPLASGVRIDLAAQGWPATRAAALAAEWIRLMDAGEWAPMGEYDRANRPPDVLASRPEAQREATFVARAREWGRVEALAAVEEPDALWVLVRTERAGCRALRFILTPRGRLEGVLIRTADDPG